MQKVVSIQGMPRSTVSAAAAVLLLAAAGFR